MSFILDALKKSETDRQQQSSAEFAKVPSSSGPNRLPVWLLVLGLLLAINLVVLLGVLFKPSTEPARGPTVATSVPSAAASSDAGREEERENQGTQGQPSFANRISEAKRNRPSASDAGAAVQPRTLSESAVPPAASSERTAPAATSLPTIYEVIADGSVVLPDLHLDIHVYSEVPQDRFVFINMSKQREKSQLSEGPVVEQITPDGVILTYRGTSFLLPRD